MTTHVLHVARVLWPAFLIACLLEMLVFSAVDPTQVMVNGWQPDTMTVYSLSFLLFWAVVAAGVELSHWMMRPVAHRTGRRHERRARRIRAAVQHRHA